MKIITWGAIVVAGAIVGSAHPCRAIQVVEGQTALLPGTTLAERPEFAGTSLAPNSFSLINSNTPGAFQAKVLFDVVQESSGSLDFTFQVVGSDVTTPLLWKLQVTNLLFPLIDTDVRLDTPGVDVPISVTVDPSGIATFSSTVALQPGQETHVFFIHAEGITQYRQGGTINLITDFGSEPVPPGEGSPNGTFEFTGYEVLPEPGSLALLGMAVGALCVRMRRANA